MSAPRSRPVASGLASLEEALRKKGPPQNLEAESSVLGALLTRPTMFDSLLPGLRTKDGRLYLAPENSACPCLEVSPSFTILPVASPPGTL